MKISITAKLFVAVLATALLVALAMGVAAHINLKRGFLGYLNEQGELRLEAAVPGVTAGYRANGNSWNFLREHPELWYKQLRPLADDEGRALDPRERPPPTVSELTGATRRFALYDTARRRVAGFEGSTAPEVERPIVVDGATVGWLTMARFET
ncbi:MAG: two-component sensor histidine kinase, partial [Rhizobacter sp.]